MENKKPLYQPWNEEEFQGDVYVRGMNHVQRWMYRTLLQAAFFHSTRPYLPNDDEVLWVLAGCESIEEWQQNKDKILKRFRTIEVGGENLLENKRVSSDWARLESKRDQMAELSEKAVEARRAKKGEAVLLVPGGNRTITSTESKEREKVETELKVSESESSNTPTNQPSFWSDIRHLYKRFFNKKPDQARHGRNYEAACKTYGTEIVTTCLESWLEGNAEWCKEKGIDQPLSLFFKKLPEMAADEIESREEDKQAEIVKEQEKQQAQQRAAEIESNIQRQESEDWERMNRAPKPENGASVLDYLADIKEPENEK